MKDVSSKNIWIIGASSGIGEALAKELAQAGAKLAVSARRADKLEALVAELSGDGHIVAPLDVSDAGAVAATQDEIIRKSGRIDSVIFLAAIYKPFDGDEKSLDHIRQSFDINVMGAFNLLDSLVPYYKAQGGGQVVLCGSVAGYRGLPMAQPYCATKAAIISLAESRKLELALKNIDVKVICPGFVKTPLTDENDFAMPAMVTADYAARVIHKGICSKTFEIHFPKRFTYFMKFLRIIPNALYFALAKNIK